MTGLPVGWLRLGLAVGLRQTGLSHTGAAGAAADRSQGNHSLLCMHNYRLFKPFFFICLGFFFFLYLTKQNKCSLDTFHHPLLKTTPLRNCQQINEEQKRKLFHTSRHSFVCIAQHRQKGTREKAGVLCLHIALSLLPHLVFFSCH